MVGVSLFGTKQNDEKSTTELHWIARSMNWRRPEGHTGTLLLPPSSPEKSFECNGWSKVYRFEISAWFSDVEFNRDQSSIDSSFLTGG
jgi:hypothetical protein